jgi:hypothetical protein
VHWQCKSQQIGGAARSQYPHWPTVAVSRVFISGNPSGPPAHMCTVKLSRCFSSQHRIGTAVLLLAWKLKFHQDGMCSLWRCSTRPGTGHRVHPSLPYTEHNLFNSPDRDGAGNSKSDSSNSGQQSSWPGIPKNLKALFRRQWLVALTTAGSNGSSWQASLSLTLMPPAGSLNGQRGP